MKTIKFRAWDYDLSEMRKVSRMDFPQEVTLNGCNGRAFLDYDKRSKDCVLMQWTRLRDKKWKEIYEGDILLVPDTDWEYIDVGVDWPWVKVAEFDVNHIVEVIFHNCSFWFTITEEHEKMDIWFYPLFSGLEVIWNRYENPELLN